MLLLFKRLIRQVYWFLLGPVLRKLDRINENQKTILFMLEYKKQSSVKRNKVIYTCITGNYDGIPWHSYINFDYDYVCFTDNTELLKYEEFGIWKIRPVEYTKLNNVKNSRWHKMHPHILFPDYEKSIWIDGNIDVKTNHLFRIVEEADGRTLKIQMHPCRNCIFEEIEAVLGGKRDKKDITDKISVLLKKERFPRHYGLNDCSIIYREHHDEAVIEIMNSWWEMLELYSHRDQLSLSYVLWKNRKTPAEIGIPNIRNDTTNYQYIVHTK
jgi:hypothetical protein